MDHNTAVAAPVLNIAGCQPLERREQTQNTTELQLQPEFDRKEFPAILREILLKPDQPANSKRTEFDDKKCLAVMCLLNKKTKVRMYHMYCTNEHRVWIDYDKVELLYKDMNHTEIWCHLIVHTSFPESLLRNALQHLTMYKWSKDGNVFETPMSETDEKIILKKLQELCTDKQEDQMIINYIKFLNNEQKINKNITN